MLEKRSFTFVDDGSNKFWEIWGDGNEVRTRYGKTGSNGQTTIKDEGSVDKAKKLYDKLIAEKTKKGYVEHGATANAVPAASAPVASTAKASAGVGSELIARKLRYEMADFDCCDTYLFGLTTSGGDLKVHFQMGDADEGEIQFVAKALDDAKGFVCISQGSAMSSNLSALPELVVADVPPFLLPRAVFAALKANGSAEMKGEWSPDSAGPAELTLEGKTKLDVKIDGKNKSVDVLHATGEDIELWVIDDDAWPVIVKREECGDNYWKLLEAAKDLQAKSSDDDDDDDGEGGGWRRFEVDEKFWAIKLDGASHTVKFGKIGTDGQEKTKDFDDEEAAEKDYRKLIAEKTKKGYEEAAD